MNRTECPECGEKTEFIQFTGENQSVTQTTPEEVGDGLLELRACNNCPASIENVLNVKKQNVELHQ